MRNVVLGLIIAFLAIYIAFPAFSRLLPPLFCPQNCAECRRLGWSAYDCARCPRLDRDRDGVACYGS